MSEQRRIAVIVIRHDMTVAQLTLDQARSVFVNNQNSVLRYWRENAENWFQLSPIDFFGPYDVTLPAPPSARANTRDVAKAAAQSAGVNLSPYDGLIIIVHPGAAMVAGKVTGFDGGAAGQGPGADAILPSSGDLTFFCHETGHMLGFGHTYGILNAGADWSDDGITQLYAVYGDPYDLMSSASFGGAAPQFTLLVDQAVPNFPNALSAGPMLSRAHLHFTRPAALEVTNKVQHIYEGGVDQVFTVFPAGQGDPGKTELVVYHPANEDSQGRGRVYVEYRQPFNFNWASRWDQGLGTNQTDRDNCGLVVHVVKNAEASNDPAVWYAGRLVFPSPDSDLEIDTPRGRATVTVSQEFVQQKSPAYVRVRVNRQHISRVSILEKATETITVLSSEKRPIPGWEWAGLFTWERRQTIRKVEYTPIVSGLGGAGFTDGHAAVTVYWYVGGYRPGPGDSGVTSVMGQGGTAFFDVKYNIDPDTRVLTLSNQPDSAAYTIGLFASASDASLGIGSVTSNASFWAPGITEGWGADYDHFMDAWDRITHPIPKHRFGPPKPDDYRAQVDNILQVFDKLRSSNPEVATNVQPVILAHVGVLRKMATPQH
jgi:hypothetical protein